MLTAIDHLVVACDDPTRVALELERELGLHASGGGRHEAFGTINRLVWFGDSYLELVGVADRGVAETSWFGRPTLAALATGGGFATYAVASDDLAGDLARLRSAGAQLEGPLAGERRRPDDRLVRWSTAVPVRLGPSEPPFIIEHDVNAAEWTPAERLTRSEAPHPLGAAVRLERLEIAVDDVHRVAMRYVRSLAMAFRPSLAGRGARDAALGTQTVRLRPSVASWLRPAESGPGSGPAVVATIVLRATASIPAREAMILGCRFVVEASR